MATGISTIGLQVLDTLPYDTTNRVFIADTSPQTQFVINKGTISIEYAYQGNDSWYVVEAKTMWRNGLLFFNLPLVAGPVFPVIQVVANWRVPGIQWQTDAET